MKKFKNAEIPYVEFYDVKEFLNSGEFEHLDREDLETYDYIRWYSDGTIYGAKNGSMHDIDQGCGNPLEPDSEIK